MNVASQHIVNIYIRNGPYYLVPFDSVMASTVSSWVRDDHELFWLAPKTIPPLTAGKVAGWPESTGCPMLFYRDGLAQPLGYLELNPMPGHPHHLWLGHCIICPEKRGMGLGRVMVNLMLDEAFNHRQANRVSLVVFPDNTVAIRCYRDTGFVCAGDQLKYFHNTGRQHRMLRMTIDKSQYNWRFRQNSPI